MTGPPPQVDDDDVIAAGGGNGWALFNRFNPGGRDGNPMLRRLRAVGTELVLRWSTIAPPRRRLITIVAIVVALVGAGTAITLGRPSSQHRARSAATKPVTTQPLPRPATTLPGSQSSYDPEADISSLLGPALVVPGGVVRDVGVEDDDLYVLSASALSVVHSYDRRLIASASVASPSRSRVVLDEATGTVWDVALGQAGLPVREFTFTDLRATRTIVMPFVVYDSVVLAGGLYLATSGGVFLVVPGSATMTAVVNSTPPVQALTADADVGTVLALTSGPRARIITISDDGRTVQAGPTINISSPTIAVIKDALWVGAVGADARLERFDEATLRPLPESAGGVIVAEGAGAAGIQLVAGAAALWVYPLVIEANLWVLAKSTQQLYCIDSSSGLVLQRWDHITHPVSTGGSGPYIVTDQGVQPLVLRGNCTG